MSTVGLVMMIAGNLAIVVLCTYCFYRVLTATDVVEREHAPLDIDTRDQD